MDTSLLLWVWMLLSVEVAIGIKCIQCRFLGPGSICLFHRRHCRLYVGQSCYKKTVFYGRRLIYSYQSCTTKCLERYEEPKEMYITQTVKCCSHRNFCNL